MRLALALMLVCAAAHADKPRSLQDILAASPAADWKPLDPESTVYLDLAAGRVVIALAPEFAPRHAANLRALIREKYFDGLRILRSQENYVVQWGDADPHTRPIRVAKPTLPPEFTRPSAGLPWTPLPDGDVYAPEVGFADGFPAARDPKSKTAWLAHCYAMVGAGRDAAIDSGGGSELYVVIGHAPRHLDRNITLVGRVVQGMELLTTQPRGTGALGFYEKPQQGAAITAMRVAADLPAAERTRLEVLRSDSPTFAAAVESRRNRRDDWYKTPAGKIDLCNAPLPVRPVR